jgi:hypothetical protein
MIKKGIGILGKISLMRKALIKAAALLPLLLGKKVMSNSNNFEITERPPIRIPYPDELDDEEDSEDKDKKAFGGEIKDFRDNGDNSVQMGAYGGTISGDNKEKKKTYIPKVVYDMPEVFGWEHGVEKEPLIRHIKNVNGMEGEDAENFIKENYIEIEEESLTEDNNKAFGGNIGDDPEKESKRLREETKKILEKNRK